MKLIDLIIRPLGGTFRTRKTVELFSKYLNEDDKVLDLGAGSGQIGEYINKKIGCKVTLIDVIDYNQTNLKFILYDGKRIPFRDNSFDIILVIFVLHHSKNQLQILNEAKRVAKKIIILEDTPKNRLEKIFWKFWDWLLNLGHDVNMPFTVKTNEDWLKTFKELNLNIIYQKKFRSILPVFASYQQSLFILGKE